MSRGKKLKDKKLTKLGKSRLYFIKLGDNFIRFIGPLSYHWANEIVGNKIKNERHPRYHTYWLRGLYFVKHKGINDQDYESNGWILNLKDMKNHKYPFITSLLMITQSEMVSDKNYSRSISTYVRSVNFE